LALLKLAAAYPRLGFAHLFFEHRARDLEPPRDVEEKPSRWTAFGILAMTCAIFAATAPRPRGW